MTDREDLAETMEAIADYFDRREREAVEPSKNVFWTYARAARRAAETLMSDEETLSEYAEAIDRMEDDGK